MLFDFYYFKTAAITLFVAVDPPGLAPIFVGLTAAMTDTARRSAAKRASVLAFCVLTLAAFGGESLLTSLGISMPAFRIAGGLLLFYIASEMVFEKREDRKASAVEGKLSQDQYPHDIAAFPLAIPLMAGPGAITATILQSSAAHGSAANLGALIVILALVCASCYGTFRLADTLDRLMGVTGRVVMSRLLGVLLAAMAVQIVGDGVLSFR